MESPTPPPSQPDIHPTLSQLLDGISLTGTIAQDVPTFLIHHGCPETAEHSADVAAEARRVATLVGEDPTAAELAGWLHDCSAIFPDDERVEIARCLHIPALPEEEQFPMIIHQKLSKRLSSDLFGIHDDLILNAVGCHTTLRADSTRLDKVLFVADKIAWDQSGIPPYRDELLDALDHSLDQAALVYIRYLWDRRHTLRVLHPWLRDAYIQLTRLC
jgi:predicted HD superfamily hydrolase involved in NAD metabolism